MDSIAKQLADVIIGAGVPIQTIVKVCDPTAAAFLVERMREGAPETFRAERVAGEVAAAQHSDRRGAAVGREMRGKYGAHVTPEAALLN